MHGLEAKNLDGLTAHRPGRDRDEARELKRQLTVRRWLLIGLYPMILVPSILHLLSVA
jgi:hypothetical protein